MENYKLYLMGEKLMFNSQHLGNVLRMDDGYYVFFNNNSLNGYYTSETLDTISKFIKNMNKEWDEQIQEYFKDK